MDQASSRVLTNISTPLIVTTHDRLALALLRHSVAIGYRLRLKIAVSVLALSICVAFACLLRPITGVPVAGAKAIYLSSTGVMVITQIYIRFIMCRPHPESDDDIIRAVGLPITTVEKSMPPASLPAA